MTDAANTTAPFDAPLDTTSGGRSTLPLPDIYLNDSCLRTDAAYEGFDNNVGDTWIYPTNYPVRRYQHDISHMALFRNTLVVLPTGLGKTFLAAVVMYNIYRWYPRGIVIFMAPTRTLVAQQIEACYQVMGIPRDDTVELTGRQSKSVRSAAWNSKRVFFVTPQVLAIDMLEPDFPVAAIKLLVVDEAHRARGRYAYTDVCGWLHQRRPHFRILALTATPGRGFEDVSEIVRNLHITHVELRTERSPDVQPYTHAKRIRTCVVQLSAALHDVRQQLIAIIDPYVQHLLALDVIAGTVETLSKGWLLMQQKRFVETSQRQQRHPQHSAAMADFSACITLYHGLELLERHGVRIFMQFFADTDRAYLCNTDAGLRELLDGLRAELVDSVGDVVERASPPPSGYDFGHPKYEQLRTELRQHFERHGPDTRSLVFCEFRNSVLLIEWMLQQDQPLLRPRAFVGQGGGGGVAGKPVTQKQQLAIMEEFRAGAVNVLIATCVAEEGIDVGEIDLIVCFDMASRNPTRFVQRIGRTGRKRDGQIVMLVTEGREQRMLRDVLATRNAATTMSSADRAKLETILEPSSRMVPEEYQPKCLETFIRVAGVVPLAKESEVGAVSSENAVETDRPAAPTQRRGRKTKEVTIPKGVRDVRQFFKPLREMTGNVQSQLETSRTPAGIDNLAQTSVIYEDADVSINGSPQKNGTIDVSPQKNGTLSPPPHVLRDLRNLRKLRVDLLGTKPIASVSTLSMKAVLKRGRRVPMSLQQLAIANSATSTPSSDVHDEYAELFNDIDADGARMVLNMSELRPLVKTIDVDSLLNLSSLTDENGMSPNKPDDAANPQLASPTLNASIYSEWCQEQSPAKPFASVPLHAVANENTMRNFSTPVQRQPKLSECFDPLKRRQSAKKTTSNKKLTNESTTPIREAFKRLFDKRTPDKRTTDQPNATPERTPKSSTDAAGGTNISSLLAYFRLSNILDIFANDKHNRTEAKTPKDIGKLVMDLSDMFDDSFQPEANTSIKNSGVCDYVPEPSKSSSVYHDAHAPKSPSPETPSIAKPSSDEMIQSSQDAAVKFRSSSIASKLANTKRLILRPIATLLEKTPSESFQRSFVQPTEPFQIKSQLEKGQPESIQRSTVAPKSDQPKTPPRPSAAQPFAHPDRSPSVLNFARLRKLKLESSQRPQSATPNPPVQCSSNDAMHASPNQSVIGVRPKSSRARRILDDDSSSSDDGDFETADVVDASPQTTVKPRVPTARQQRRQRCAFVDDECDVSDDIECSEDDEDPHNSKLVLDSFVCDDRDQTIDTAMHAKYLQSIRSPCRPYGAYRMTANRPPMNHSDIFSQRVPTDDDASDESFVVHNNDDNDCGADAESRLSQLDELDRAELILRQRRRAKRLGIELLSDEDDVAVDDERTATPGSLRRPKKRRKIIQVLDSSSSSNEEPMTDAKR